MVSVSVVVVVTGSSPSFSAGVVVVFSTSIRIGHAMKSEYRLTSARSFVWSV